jgi:hypothetical protein
MAPPLIFLLFVVLIVVVALAVFATGLGGALWGDRTRRGGDAEMHPDADPDRRAGVYAEQRERERSTSFTDHPSGG